MPLFKSNEFRSFEFWSWMKVRTSLWVPSLMDIPPAPPWGRLFTWGDISQSEASWGVSALLKGSAVWWNGT